MIYLKNLCPFHVLICIKQLKLTILSLTSSNHTSCRYGNCLFKCPWLPWLVYTPHFVTKTASALSSPPPHTPNSLIILKESFVNTGIREMQKTKILSFMIGLTLLLITENNVSQELFVLLIIFLLIIILLILSYR